MAYFKKINIDVVRKDARNAHGHAIFSLYVIVCERVKYEVEKNYRPIDA